MSWLNIAIANEENANQTWFPQFSLGRTPRTAKGPIVLALIWPMRTDRLCQCKGLRSVDNQHPQTRAGVFSSSAFNARSFGCRFLCPPSHGNASCLSDSVWAWLLTLLRVGGQICPRYHIFAYTRLYIHIHAPIFFDNSSFWVRKWVQHFWPHQNSPFCQENTKLVNFTPLS